MKCISIQVVLCFWWFITCMQVNGEWCKERVNYTCCSNYFYNFTTKQCQICPDGYFDKNCSKECFPGLYGRECNEFCPTVCKNTCNHITGICPGNIYTVKQYDTTGKASSLMIEDKSHINKNEEILNKEEDSEKAIQSHESPKGNLGKNKTIDESRQLLIRSDIVSIILYSGVAIVLILLIILCVHIVKMFKTQTQINVKGQGYENKTSGVPIYETIEELNIIQDNSVLSREGSAS